MPASGERVSVSPLEEGEVVRYSRGSRALGIAAGDYARIEEVDAKANQITVRTNDDRAQGALRRLRRP